MKLPDPIRRAVETKIKRQHARDQVLAGYYKAAGLAWVACIDAHGCIDCAFAEPMPAEYFAIFQARIDALVRRRVGALETPTSDSTSSNRSVH